MTNESTNPEANLGRLMGCAARVMLRELDHSLAESNVGISGEQCILLKNIGWDDGIHQNELAERILRDKAAITRHLDVLEQKKLVVREHNPTDRRQNLLHITSAGRRLLQSVEPLIEVINRRATEGIEKAKLEHCKDVLEQVFNNLAHRNCSNADRTDS
ncbi:MAG: MarR family transcriptional regulator [candidate division Zixibacteria bacterium]|nr:MarR family transcriptional regulator [candidate division Zixibacteria bacterium]